VVTFQCSSVLRDKINGKNFAGNKPETKYRGRVLMGQPPGCPGTNIKNPISMPHIRATRIITSYHANPAPNNHNNLSPLYTRAQPNAAHATNKDNPLHLAPDKGTE